MNTSSLQRARCALIAHESWYRGRMTAVGACSRGVVVEVGGCFRLITMPAADAVGRERIEKAKGSYEVPPP